MSVADAVAVARSRWKLIAIVIILLVAVTAVAGWLQAPRYHSESRVHVTTPKPDVNMRFGYFGGALYDGLEDSYSSLFAGPSLRAEVARQLDTRSDPSSTPRADWRVASTVVVHSDDVTVIVAGESTDPDRAARATDVAAATLARTARAEAAETAVRRKFDVVVSDPTPASEPVRVLEPFTLRRIALGVVGGAVLGMAGALLLHRRDRRLAASPAVAERG